MNKGGQAGAIIIFLMLALMTVFLLYILAVPMSKVWDDISSELKQPENFGSDNRTLDEISKVDSLVTPIFDQLIFIALIGLLVSLLVLAIFTDAHPVFFIFIIIGVVVIMIIASQMVNVADTAVRNDALDDKVDDFKLANLVIGPQLPIIILIVGLVSGVIMLSRNRSGGSA